MENDQFKYLGYNFIPVEKLGGTQIELDNIIGHLQSDLELGFSTYNWLENRKDYSYEGFYKASGNSDYDIFKCLANGKLYIPGKNELFEYVYKEDSRC